MFHPCQFPISRAPTKTITTTQVMMALLVIIRHALSKSSISSVCLYSAFGFPSDQFAHVGIVCSEFKLGSNGLEHRDDFVRISAECDVIPALFVSAYARTKTKGIVGLAFNPFGLHQ